MEHMPSLEQGVAGAASEPPLDPPEELPAASEDPLEEATPEEPLLDDVPPPSSPVPELAPDEAPELPPEDPPDEPGPPSPPVVELELPPQPIPIAMAMQTPAQALEAYIRPPPKMSAGATLTTREPSVVSGGSVPSGVSVQARWASLPRPLPRTVRWLAANRPSTCLRIAR
jgi:hypothetical protein